MLKTHISYKNTVSNVREGKQLGNELHVYIISVYKVTVVCTVQYLLYNAVCAVNMTLLYVMIYGDTKNGVGGYAHIYVQHVKLNFA